MAPTSTVILITASELVGTSECVPLHLARLWIDALFFCGPILPLCLAVAEGSPVFGCACVQVGPILDHQFDDLNTPIYGPEEHEVRCFVHVVWVCSCPEQRPAALVAPPVAQRDMFRQQQEQGIPSCEQ
jgi:hypothetical protein